MVHSSFVVSPSNHELGRVAPKLLAWVAAGTLTVGLALWAGAATLTEPFTTAANYVYNAAKIVVSSGTATLKSPFSVASHTVQADFDAGTYTHASFQTDKVALGTDNPLVSTTNLVVAYPLDETSGLKAKDALETYDATIAAGPTGSGLVAYWTLDDAAGTTAADSKGTNYGTLTNGPTWVAGKYGKAVSFDGTNDYVSASDAGLPSGTAARTMAFWAKPNTTSGDRMYVMYGAYVGGQQFDLGTTTGSWYMSTGAVNTMGAAATTTWTHVAATYDGTTVKLYQNGVLTASGTPTINTVLAGSAGVNIGRFDATTQYVDGLIDDVQIYSRALSAAEVTDLYNGKPWAAGKFGNALSFDGTDDYAERAYNAALTPGSNAWTVASWVKPASGSTQRYFVTWDRCGASGTCGASDTASYRLGVSSSNLPSFYLRDDAGNTTTLTGTTNLTTGGAWYHLAATFDPATETKKLYVNGVEEASNAVTAITALSDGGISIPLGLGRRYSTGAAGSPDGYVAGSLDDVLVFKRALTAAEVATLAASTRAMTVTLKSAGTDSTISGLVSHWKFDDAAGTSAADSAGTNTGTLTAAGYVANRVSHWTFDAGTGTSAADSAGSNTGTLTNGPTWVAGKLGNALSFDGVNDYVNVADSAALDLTANATIALWLKRSALQTTTTSVVSKQNTAYILQLDGVGGLHFGKHGTDELVGGAMAPGRWYHAAATHGGGQTILYVDGVKIAQAAKADFAANTSALTIGFDAATNAYLKGTIDNLVFYNRALSAAEMVGLATVTPVWTTQARVGTGALTFDGVDDYVSVPAAPALDSATFTVSAWVKPNSVSSDQWIVNKETANNDNFHLQLVGSQNGTVVFGFWHNTAWREALTTTTVPTGTWTHLAGSYDGATVKTFINGVLSATLSYAATPPTGAALRIGGRYNDAGYFNGSLDDVQLYNRALTDAEVASLAAEGRYQSPVVDSGLAAPTWETFKPTRSDTKGEPLEKPPVGYWKFDEGTGTTAADAGPAAATGTLTNGPTWSTDVPTATTTFFSDSNSLLFDGVDDNVTASDAGLPAGATARTIAFWAKPTVDSVDHMAISYGTNTAQQVFVVKIQSATNKWSVGQGGANVDGNVAVSGQWIHVTVTYDGTTFRLYENGVLTGSGALTVNTVLGGLFCFGRYLDGTQKFAGSLDDVAIYNRALTVAEIAALATGRARPRVQADTYEKNLVSLWHFDNDTTDFSGTNTGTLSGATFQEGLIGPAASFDGTDDRITVSSPSGVNLTTFTVAGWVRPNVLGRVIMSLDNHANNGGVYLDDNSTGNELRLLLGNNAGSWVVNVASTGGTLTVGAWNHIAVVRTAGTDVKFYVNGQLRGSPSASSNVSYTSTTPQITIGADYDTNVAGSYRTFFNGQMDDLGIYNAALTAAQVTDLYNRGAVKLKYQVRLGTANPPTGAWTGSNGPSTTKSPGLVSFWKFEEGTGQSAADSKGTNAGQLGALADPGADDPTWSASGKVGGALSFDGTSDYLDVPDSASLDGMAGLTLSAWIKRSGTGTDTDAVANKWGTSIGVDSYAFEIASDNLLKFYISDGSAAYNAASATAIADTTVWHHVAGVFEGGRRIQVFVDGVSTGLTTSSVPATVHNAATALCIGAQSASNTGYFRGSIDEFALYNRALSGKEVWELYRSYDYVENPGGDYLHGVLKQRYLQYRALLDTLSETLTPDVKTVAVDVANYALDNPTIVPATGQAFTYLTSFAETVTTPAGTALKYVLSPNNGTYWYYHNGTNWVSSDGTYAQAAAASVINTNIASFDDKAYADGYLPENSTGTLKVKAFLNSDGSATPTLDALAVGHESGSVTVTAPNGAENVVAGATQAIGWTFTGVLPANDLTLEYSTDGGTNYVATPIATGVGATAALGCTPPAGGGCYNWTVPTTPQNSTYKVRVRSAGVPAIRDASNANFTVTSGALSSTNVEPASLVAGAVGNVTVSFTTVNAVAADGKIVVTFPAGFTLSSGAATAVTGTPSGIDGTLTAAISGQTVTVTRSGGTSSAAGAKSFVLSNIKNPPVGGSTGAYSIKTTNSADAVVDQDLAVAADTITSGALSSTNVEPALFVAGTVNTVTVSFTTANALPADGKIVVTFPAGFALSSGAATAVTGTPSGLDGTLTAAVAGQVVTVTRSGGTSSAAGAKSFQLSNIKNPTAEGSTGTYAIKTTTTADVLIDQDLAVAADTITSGVLTSTSVTPASLVHTKVGNVTVSLTAANAIPADGKIVVTFPAGFALSSGSATAVTGTPSGLDGTLAAAVAGQVVTVTRSGGTSAAAGAKSFVLTNIQNPATTGATGLFAIRTATTDGTKIDEKTDVAAVTITGSILSITAPIASDIWPVTTTKTIKWAVDGPIPTGGTVKLSYSADDGSTWTAIVGAETLDATTGATGFAWPVPLNAASATAKIKVENNPAWTPNAAAGISAQYKVSTFVTTIAPNGGEKWAVGAAHTISWQTQGTVANVKLEYSKDNGSTWTTILASTTNDGSEPWTPVAADAGAAVTVRVSNAADAGANDVSNASFKVSDVAVTAPTASGVRWLAGSSQTLTWTSTAVTNVQLAYSTAGSGGPWTNIGAPVAASGGSLSWTVANKTSTTTYIRIMDSDAAPAANGSDTALATDLSDNTFAIYGTLDVTAPDTLNLEWASGQAQTITWTTSPANADVVPTVKIEVTDLINSANNQVIIASTTGHNVAAGSGSYAWTPNFTTTSAKIKVTDAADAATTNQAANAFQLTGVAINLPVGAEVWTIGTQQTVKFGFTGTMTTAKLEYSKDNGSTWTTAATGGLQTSPDGTTWTAYAGDGSAVPVGANPFFLRWTIPDAISSVDQAKVRVTNPSTNAQAISPGFTITGTLTMDTPSGALSVGDAVTLNWGKVGTIGTVKVEFKPDGDFTAGTPALVGTALTGTSTSWTVPDNIGTTGKLRVTDTVTGHPVITGTSNAFSIKGKLTFNAPQPTTVWAVGSSQTVTWATNGTIGTVKLEYATAADNYVSWTALADASSLANTGTYTWNPLPDVVGGTVNPPNPIANPTNGTRQVKLRITDLTAGHTGAIQEIRDSSAFTGKWFLVTYNVQNQDAQFLASLNVIDSGTWNITDGSLTSPSQSKRHYKQEAITTTWSKPQFTAATVNFTADTDKTITAVLESETPTVFDVKFESFYDATTDTVKAKSFLFRRGLLLNDASLTASTITIYDGATQKATYTDSAPDANGVFDFSFKAKDAGLTAASSFLVKVSTTYSGQVKTGAGTLNITLPSETKSIINLTGTAADAAAANTLFGKMADIKTEVIDRLGSLNDAAAASSLFGRLKNLDKLLGVSSDTGSAESVFGRLAKTQSDMIAKVQAEAVKGTQTGILNREQFVKTGARATIRYRTATGLVPKIDVYDAASSKRVGAATMTEIASTGIYEYPVTFDTGWGTGDYTIVVSESTKSSTDSMIMTVMSTDLEAIAKKAGGTSAGGGGTAAAVDVAPIMAELQALRGMVTLTAGTGGLVTQVAAMQQQLSTMQAHLGLVGAVEEDEEATTEAVHASTQATMSVRDQLKEITKALKAMSGPTGSSLHQLYDMQEAQISSAKDLQNKIEQIKQATEVTKRIAEEGRQKVQVQTWFEAGSVILKILAVNPTDEEQTVPVKAYLPKEVKAEHVMDLGSLKLDYDPDRQMHFVTATVTLQPNESAVYAIEVEDIWQISQAVLTRLSDDAKAAVKQLAGTEYEERAAMLASQIDLKLASIWERQSDPTLTPEQHIQTYRQNIEAMKRLEDDLALLKRMAVTVMSPDAPKTPDSEFLNQAFSGVSSNWDESGAPIAVSLKSRLTTDATWRLIFGMLVFVGLMSLAAFLLWQRQAHLAMTAEASLLEAGVPPNPSPGVAPGVPGTPGPSPAASHTSQDPGPAAPHSP